MSTYVLMRVLESAPRRYDLGIRLLTLGRVERAYDRLAERVEPGQRVLDLGCGTGALAVRAARRGGIVKGIDINPEMLAIARQRVEDEHLEGRVELAEQGVAELDQEEGQSYDAVASGLCFSELSEDELTYTLGQAARVLKPGGLLLVADEVKPRHLASRAIRWLLRAPLALLTFLITQQTSRAVSDMPERLAGAGLSLVSADRSALGSFGTYVAQRRPGEDLP
jgi:ubiquinone/menaquinone biosynthesis C-methylase UbiE